MIPTYDLSKVSDSREYIKWAAEAILSRGGVPAKFIETSRDRKLVFSELSDREAIDVANLIWRDCHLQILRDWI